MLMVAITGRSGSGKSSVSKHFAALGHPVADGDDISREVTLPGSPCLEQLVAAFGQDILNPDGSLNRGVLGERAFKSPENNQKLIEITHPAIIAELERRAAVARETGAPLFFVDGAVIVGGPVQALCDKIIVLTTESRLAVSRIILRDGISKTAAYLRLSAQQPQAVLLAAADYVIENNDGETQLLKKADAILAELLKLAAGGEGAH